MAPPPFKRMAYTFDGQGNVKQKEWDLTRTDLQQNHHHHHHHRHHQQQQQQQQQQQGSEAPPEESFSWYHVELSRSYTTLASAAQYLISTLCPPLKLQDILALASNGPFCGSVDGALIFRTNSAGPASSEYTQKLSARITHDSLITVSLGRIPRLEFPASERRSVLAEVPSLETDLAPGSDDPNTFVIQTHVLEFYLMRNHLEDVNHPVPRSVSNLLVHVIDTHIDHLQDILTRLEMDLDHSEHELDIGGDTVKQRMLSNRLFPKMQLKLQRLLQVISHAEQVFPRFKEKLESKNWCASEDLTMIQTLVGRLQKQKENVGFLASRITALQAGLDTWQSEQINRKLYYLSFFSIIFLPLSIITSAFGMNVGGVPWTEQRNPELKDGFRNVLFLCGAILLVLLACFSAAPLYKRLRALWSTNKKKWKASRWSVSHSNDYIPVDR